MSDTRSTERRAVLLAIALLPALLPGCRDADQPLAPALPAVPVRAFTIAPNVLDALADAEARLAPALGTDVRAPMQAALAELRAALDAGERTRSAQAQARVTALLAPSAAASAPDSAGSATDDLADRAAIAVLLTVTVPDSTRPR